jgi:uncharacterized protein YjcR
VKLIMSEDNKKRPPEKIYNKYNDKNKHITHPKGFWDKNGKYRSGLDGRRDERQRKRCGAKKRRDGQPCQRWAMKNGRCRLHGGKNVGSPGKKNALKTGEHETIWHDVLEKDENLFLDELKLDVETQLNEEIKLITVRERRMLQRIKELQEHTFTTVEINEETEEGFGKSGAIDLKKKSKKKVATLTQINTIEEALTRVQEKKAKLLDLKHRVTQTSEQDEGALDALVAVIDASRKRLGKAKTKSDKLVAPPDGLEDDEDEDFS